MSVVYVDFNPGANTAFQFAAVLDGVQYNAIITWNIFGLRWYLNLYTTQGALVYATPVVESPSSYDITLLPQTFTSTLVFRKSSQQFEISDAPIAHPDFDTIPDYMLDAALGKFVLDSSSLLGNDVMFDATGKAFILNQSSLKSDSMLDVNGSQFVLDQSTMAASQDLTGQAMLDNTGKPVTLDQSQIP